MLLFFAVAYLLWFFIIKSKIITITAAQQFKLLVAIVGTGNLYFICILINTFTLHTDTQFDILPNYQLSFSLTTIFGFTYLVLVSFKVLQIFYSKLFNKDKLQPLALTDEFNNYLNLLCDHIKVKVPKLYWSNSTLVPYTKGLFRKIIVFPIAIANQFTIAEMEAILLHEIAHIKRNDHIWNIILQFGQIIFSLNPFAQILIKKAFYERELACDDWVLTQEMQPKVYANALYKIAQQNVSLNAQLAAAVPQKGLLFRVQRLFDANLSLPIKINWKIFTVLFIGIFLLQINTYKNNITVDNQIAKNRIAIKSVESELGIATKANAESKHDHAKSKTITNKALIKFIDTLHKTISNDYDSSYRIVNVSDVKAKSIQLQNYVKSYYSKVDNTIFSIKDSIGLFVDYVSNTNVNDVSNNLLQELLSVITKENLQSDITIESEKMPIQVTQNGMQNIYFKDATIQFYVTRNESTNSWEISIKIENNSTLIAKRNVVVSLNKTLQQISL